MIYLALNNIEDEILSNKIQLLDKKLRSKYFTVHKNGDV
jgi:hypothetical protein